MDVIPVLDLKGGRAVHARRGERERYQVVAGALGSGDDPVALATSLRDRLGCRQLYVADLDALGGAGAAPNGRTMRALAALGLELWVDAGVRSVADAVRVLEAGAARVIAALETLPGLDALGAIMARIGVQRTVFSLDLRDGFPLAADPALADDDPLAIAQAVVGRGVQTLIALDLARIGASAGPPLPLLAQLHAALPGTQLVAGGGVRDVADLESLSALGCSGALVATALHEGKLSPADMQRFQAAAAPPGPRA